MWLWLWACGESPPTTAEQVEKTLESPKTTEKPKPTSNSIDKSKLTIKDGMVQIPEGLVDLGPRHVEAVKGYTLPQNPMGRTSGEPHRKRSITNRGVALPALRAPWERARCQHQAPETVLFGQMGPDLL